MKMSETKKKPEGAVAVAAPRKVSVLASLASKLEVDPSKLAEVLKKTAFAACRNDEEFIAMCMVANKYGLDPITKEIYAFPNKKTGAVIPVVGYDGWQKLANRHPMYDGCDFVEADDGSWCECRIYRKDRTHPTAIREYLVECRMDTMPWQKYPRRMLRNKAFNQCARAAFNLSGIYDEDEAERIRQCEAAEIARIAADQQPRQTKLGAHRKSATQLLAAKEQPPVEAVEVPTPEEQPEPVPAPRDPEVPVEIMDDGDGSPDGLPY